MLFLLAVSMEVENWRRSLEVQPANVAAAQAMHGNLTKCLIVIESRVVTR